MASAKSSKVIETAYWDTNALHQVALYLDHASKFSLYPYSESIHDAVDAVAKLDDKAMKDACQNGLDVLAFCLPRSLRIAYSPVSQLELIVGRARGKALQKAAGVGMSERMWWKFGSDEAEVDQLVAGETLTTIRVGILALSNRLGDLDVKVVEGSESGVTELWALTKELAGLVYMSTIDCVIYAAALLEQARYLVTYDGYLRKTVNRIHNPNNARFRGIREDIRDTIERLVGSTRELDRKDVMLPVAPKNELKQYRSKSTREGRRG